MAAELPTGGVIYGIRLRSDLVYRYIGLTTKSAETRLRKHLQVARSGRKTPFYDWLRAHEGEAIDVDLLDCIEDLDELGQAEIDWIKSLRRQGFPLLNLSEGGLGPMGVEWTVEMRDAARVRSTGRKGVSRYAADNPFYGRTHAAEQRAKWSKTRKGQNAGPDNPNFGKFGIDHPGFGRVMSQEAREALAE
jgi:hypothetical protein